MTNLAPNYWLNSFDVQTELFLNRFAGHLGWFDRAVLLAAGSNLTTAAVIVFLFWMALFDPKRSGRLRDGAELLLASAFFAMLATLTARALALSLPFRARPMATPSLPFLLPAGGSTVVIHWSSFPSDHATLFFAMAAGILLVSRRLGWCAVAWVILVISFPALYLGIHWPTDVLAGAGLGICFAQFARIPRVRAITRQMVAPMYEKRPAIFLPVLFLWSYETTVLFDDIRRVLFFVFHGI